MSDKRSNFDQAQAQSLKVQEYARFPVLDISAGKAQFQGTVRCWDESSRRAFAIGLPNRCVAFGEWRPRFYPDGNTFDADIVSFGYNAPETLGASRLALSDPYSPDEYLRIKLLVDGLFVDENVRKAMYLSKSSKGRYTGHVNFLDAWIRLT